MRVGRAGSRGRLDKELLPLYCCCDGMLVISIVYVYVIGLQVANIFGSTVNVQSTNAERQEVKTAMGKRRTPERTSLIDEPPAVVWFVL